jgi:hypothetical protein
MDLDEHVPPHGAIGFVQALPEEIDTKPMSPDKAVVSFHDDNVKF